MAVTIRFDSDPSGALDGTREVEDALDDLGGRLDEVARDGEDAAAGLGQAFGDAGDEIEDAGEAGGDSLGDVGEAGDGAGVSVRSLGRIAKEAIQGDLVGAASAALPVIGSFGPAFAIAGGLAVGALALTKTALDESAAATVANKDAAADWAAAYIAAAGDVVGAAQVTAAVQQIATDPAKYETAQQNARDWGVEVSTAMRAMAGDATALAVAEQNLADRQAEVVTGTGAMTRALATEGGQANETLRLSVERGSRSLQQLNLDMEAGRSIAGDTSDALLSIVASADSAGVEVDELGNKLYTLPDGTQVLVNADTGRATQDLSTFQGDLDGISEKVTTADVEIQVNRRKYDDFVKETKKGIGVLVKVQRPYGGSTG